MNGRTIPTNSAFMEKKSDIYSDGEKNREKGSKFGSKN